MEKKKSNKILTIALGILFLAIGVTFAYFVASTRPVGEGGIADVTTVTIQNTVFEVEGGLHFNDLDMLPGHKNVSSIKVTATGSDVVHYNLIWNGKNGLNTPLNFTVYKTNTELDVKATCTKKNEKSGTDTIYFEECEISNLENLGDIVSTGTINTSTENTKVVLAENEFITATTEGTKNYYYVILEYPNLDREQNEDIGQTFEGIVTVEQNLEAADVNVVAVYVKQDDGTYKLQKDIPSKGYVLDEIQSTCTKNAKPKWVNNTFVVSNLTEVPVDCSLYFEKATGLALEMANAKPSPEEFTEPATTDEGMYYTEDDDGTTYYFRGNVANNWVQFAGFYWRIIRVNGDGSIRMIYNGTTTDQIGETTQIQTSAYNTSRNDNAYVGYMYGSTGASTYAATHANTNNSTIKGIVDSWYKTNIVDKGYSGKVSTDAGFCNDRSVASSSETWWTSDTKKGYGTNTTAYGSFSRIITTSNSYNATQTPSFKCMNKSADLFTPSGSSKGNKKLTYPVGLITADETIFGGGFGGTGNRTYYLYTNQYYWTMSPSNMNTNGNAVAFYVYSDGVLGHGNGVYSTNGVRPVINLTADVKLSGSGTTSDPYKIVED